MLKREDDAYVMDVDDVFGHLDGKARAQRVDA